MPGVLICDDSGTMRLALRRTLESGGMQVLAEAASGEDAVKLAKQMQPDLITMDVMLPGMDGFMATKAILANGPARIVIVSAAGEALQADLSFRALQAGALDLVDKPDASVKGAMLAWAEELLMRLRVLQDLPLGSRPAGLPRATRPTITRRDMKAFGIVASTGGPPTLAQVVKDLDPSLPFPLLVAMHIAPGFTAGLARWLATQTRLEVRVAEGGELATPGTVWLPRDGNDLLWHNERLRVMPTTGGVCPNGDRLLQSLAAGLGRQAGGAVLTGMGADGALGLLALKDSVGLTFAQDAASCVVDGMPSAAVAKGGADQRLTPEELGFCIAELGRLKSGAENPASQGRN